MKWPWQSKANGGERLAFSLRPDALIWMLADCRAQRPVLLRCGHLALDTPPTPAQVNAVRALQLGGSAAWAMLPLSAYQMLQIDCPAVPPEELRIAARWQIRDRVDSHVDDLTLDVLRVGAPRAPAVGNGQLFVVATANAKVHQVSGLAQAAGWTLEVIDVLDLAQRNLHTAAAQAMDLEERATACLMRHGKDCLLTICVGEELYYSRRLEWDAKLAQRATEAEQAAAVAAARSPDELSLEAMAFPMAVELGAPSADDSSRLVVELQRSFDVWERAGPDLPLAVLLLHGDSAGDGVAAYLQDQLRLRVLPLDTAAALDSSVLDQADAVVRENGTALLGTLLRAERREP
jgi:MSHA biogenesis protein MshI